ncbi:MAG: GNAT family N-acetyltransferase [Sulfitobacter sp.]
MDIRLTQAADIPALKTVLDQTDLFPSEMLPDMLGGFLKAVEPDELWLTCVDQGAPIGLCYAKPEMLANGTWNMLAIAVHPDHQRRGAGGALTSHLELALKHNNQRILIVDTSGSAAFDNTRSFYLKNGYTQESRIRDYWAPGDDKVTFWKQL